MSTLIITMITAYSQAQDSNDSFTVVIWLIIMLILWYLIDWERSGNLDDSKGARLYDVETLVRRIQYRQKTSAARTSEDTHEEKKRAERRRPTNTRDKVSLVNIQQAIFSTIFIVSYGIIILTRKSTTYSFFVQYLPWLADYTGVRAQFGLGILGLVSLIAVILIHALKKQN